MKEDLKAYLRSKLNETRWQFGPQDVDFPIENPTSPTPPQPVPVNIPGIGNGWLVGDDLWVHDQHGMPTLLKPNRGGPGTSPTHTNQPVNIPSLPQLHPSADPRTSDTNSPMEIRPTEILPGIFDTGTIQKPNGNSPPIIWYQEQDGTWHRGVLQCTFTGCVYGRSDDIFDVGRDSPPDGYVIWNPNPAPGHFEVYHEPKFDWWPFW